MSELSRETRRKSKERMRDILRSEPGKVDASDFTPAEELDAGVKTGPRPVSRRQYKRGGKVEGREAVKHAGRKPRKSGGSALVNDFENRDVREANEKRDGVKKVGAFKRGGRTGKDTGGATTTVAPAVPDTRFTFGPSDGAKFFKRGGEAHPDEKADRTLVKQMVKATALTGRKDGGRAKRADGGGIKQGWRGSWDDGPDAPPIPKGGYNDPYEPTPKKKGGSVSDGELEGTRPTGGRLARAYGGPNGEQSHRVENGDWVSPKEYHLFQKTPQSRSLTDYSDSPAMGITKYDRMVGKAKTLKSARSAIRRRDEAYGTSAHYYKPFYEDEGAASGGRMARKDGGKNWIAGAIKHPGALHKELHVKEGEKIPAKKLEKAEHSKNPTLAKRARLAETLKGLGREHRASGGRAKGKTNINIIIGTGGQKPPGMQPPIGAAPIQPPPVGPNGAMGPGAGGPQPMPPAPMGAAPMPGAPTPALPRKSGGRTYGIDTGAGGGKARLDKRDWYGDQ